MVNCRHCLLQELNPTPFAAMILNHTGWVVYSVLHTDWFIFTMDASGLIIGTWMMFSLYPLAHTTVQDTSTAAHEKYVLQLQIRSVCSAGPKQVEWPGSCCSDIVLYFSLSKHDPQCRGVTSHPFTVVSMASWLHLSHVAITDGFGVCDALAE